MGHAKMRRREESREDSTKYDVPSTKLGGIDNIVGHNDESIECTNGFRICPRYCRLPLPLFFLASWQSWREKYEVREVRVFCLGSFILEK